MLGGPATDQDVMTLISRLESCFKASRRFRPFNWHQSRSQGCTSPCRPRTSRASPLKRSLRGRQSARILCRLWGLPRTCRGPHQPRGGPAAASAESHSLHGPRRTQLADESSARPGEAEESALTAILAALWKRLAVPGGGLMSANCRSFSSFNPTGFADRPQSDRSATQASYNKPPTAAWSRICQMENRAGCPWPCWFERACPPCSSSNHAHNTESRPGASSGVHTRPTFHAPTGQLHRDGTSPKQIEEQPR